MAMTLAAPEAEKPVVPAVNSAVASVMRILQSRGVDPAAAQRFEDRPDSTDTYQLQVNRRAWLNSLTLSGHADYKRYSLDRLEEEQHPERLRKFVDSLVIVRRHNRAQMRLPEHQRQFKRAPRLNAIMSGNIGAGKTVAAAAAGAYGVEEGLMVRFVGHSRYLSWLRPNSAPSGLTPLQVREYYERCDLLIFDDLCNELDEYATTFVRTETAELLNARLHSGRATLFTTNLSFNQVAEVLGERFASRMGSKAAHFEMVGEDRRQPIRW
ncbi:ATP-binding protein [Streptomyces sp. NPDC058758]|uniref:ATP-binding protein n=1 Tax=Streptomyces sp. NPDC058758 TaxID=3346627 RepID=UPI00368E468B